MTPCTPAFPDFLDRWNAEQGLDTPALHRRMADWLEAAWTADLRRLVMLAFRGAGKSTVVALFAAWLLVRDPALRLLVLAADGALAGKMVRNVKRIIERHPDATGLRPARPDQWASDRFTIVRPREARDPSMLAAGILANITGNRAEVVICDDVEVPNTCDTPGKRADLRLRLGEIDYVLTPDGTQLFIGTPHSHDSIYAGAPLPETGDAPPFLDGFERLELPLLDAGGRPLWPERYSDARIEEIRRRSGPNAFASQMLLRPVAAQDCRLQPDRLRRYDGALDYREGNGTARLSLEGRQMVSAACWWDPSFASPDTGDASVVAIVFTDAEGGYWLHGIRYLAVDPDLETEPAVQQCDQVAAFVRAMHAPSVTIESNGMGGFLPALLRPALARAGLAAGVQEHFSHRPKDVRILAAFDPLLAAGALHAHASVWATPFIAEMRDWRPRSAAGGGRVRDDGLDAVAGCILAEPVRLPRVPRPDPAGRDWRPGARPHRARTRFIP